MKDNDPTLAKLFRRIQRPFAILVQQYTMKRNMRFKINVLLATCFFILSLIPVSLTLSRIHDHGHIASNNDDDLESGRAMEMSILEKYSNKAKHSVATISPRCKAFQKNSTQMDLFCKDASECQTTTVKRPILPKAQPQNEELITSRNNDGTKMNKNTRGDAGSIMSADNDSTNKCKTLWITCISLQFQDEKNDLSGDGYKKEYVAALQSAMLNAKDVLQPVLVILNGSQQKQSAMFDQSQSPLASVNKLPELGVWAESLGVKVIQVFDLSFQDLVFDSFPEYRTNGKIAYFTRLDIPKYVEKYKLFDEPGICKRHLFYTDNDVLFINPLTHRDMSDLKQQLGDKILMYGQDFLINRPKPSNTGVMLMNVEGFAKEWPNMLEWVKKQKKFPEHDQVWLNHYYADPRKWKLQNALLPTYYNWKAYWQLEPNALSDVQIVHFHGPKPGVGVEAIASCDAKALDDLSHPLYKSFVQHAICCDLGKTANSIIGMYDDLKNYVLE